VRIHKHNDKARENLCQYIIRAPVALSKITYLKEDGIVIYKTNYNEYFKENIKYFKVLDFIAELTQHIPTKGQHLIRYYGLYSSRTKGVINNDENDKIREFEISDLDDQSVSNKESRKAWARLIQKIYSVDPMVCTRCGSEMKVVAFIFDKSSIKKIIDHLNKKSKGPPGS
jgi:hypothetical protein